MSQDYAKRKTKRKPANSRSSRSKPKAKPQGKHPLIWLISGIFIGVFGSFLYNLTQTSDAETETVAPTLAASKNATKDTRSEPKKVVKKGPEFEFYTTLPEAEVIIPDAEAKPVKAKEPVAYYLQASSFKSIDDAKRMRADLILQGFDVNIESNTNSKGMLWHRVILGPFANRSKMAKARSTLANKGIHPLLLKRKH